MKYIFREEPAPNIEDLKKMASNKLDATSRLLAVEELGKWKSRQSIDILWQLMMNDLVYSVKNEAFLRLQAFGEDVRLPKKKKGNLINQIESKIEKIVKSIDGPISYSDFLKLFQEKQPEAFDVYKHDKEIRFDTWLKNIINNFTTEIKVKIDFSK
ncbi:hypothetical protein [Adhaeribacter pallidiroseus]|uniref:HEAT repeat domain-containing protein n=1 Tax=Adhaeribacter pallidiroseus TaxID=2072847 RepID=A0A369QM85_9BACT|nr:hypothetical protein [Adhaeribacter pallidiroseus]RDC65834.1 hypothetical protein AHMF7616_04464 [Adhaeribacter pallidiroseus]